MTCILAIVKLQWLHCIKVIYTFKKKKGVSNMKCYICTEKNENIKLA